MSSICFDGILLAKRLVKVHGDHELGAGVVQSARQCASRQMCQYAARCTETLDAITVLLGQRKPGES